MSRNNVTHEDALRRLVAEVKLLDAVEVGERWNQLGGVLAVAEGVLRDYVEPDPVGTFLRITDAYGETWLHQRGEVDDAAVDLFAAPVAAQPVGAVQNPIGYVSASALAALTEYTENKMPNSIRLYNEVEQGRVEVPVFLAGSAAPSGEVERNAARYRFLREDPPLEFAVRRYPSETERGCYLDGVTLDNEIDVRMAKGKS